MTGDSPGLLEPRSPAEWNLTILRWLFWLSVLYALSYALVLWKAAGWWPW